MGYPPGSYPQGLAVFFVPAVPSHGAFIVSTVSLTALVIGIGTALHLSRLWPFVYAVLRILISHLCMFRQWFGGFAFGCTWESCYSPAWKWASWIAGILVCGVYASIGRGCSRSYRLYYRSGYEVVNGVHAGMSPTPVWSPSRLPP
eukprot:5812060-Pyramimonas_sp.AAC.1